MSHGRPPRTLVHGVVLVLIGLVVIGAEGPGRLTLNAITILGIISLSLGIAMTAGPGLLARSMTQRLLGGLGAGMALAVAIGTTYLAIGPVVLGILVVLALAVSVLASLSARNG